jgi:hypothetical protein
VLGVLDPVIVNGGIDCGNLMVSFTDGGINTTGLRNYGTLPNPDALEEFRVETSNSWQYGKMSAQSPRQDQVGNQWVPRFSL